MTQLPDDPLADNIRRRLHGLLLERGVGSSISLSETAQVIAEQVGKDWHEIMRPVRTVAAALASSGLIEVIQDDVTVDIAESRGPVRLRLRSAAVAMAPLRSNDASLRD